jgi:hypothetical protein
MRKILKILGIAIGSIAVIISLIICGILFFLPNAGPAPALKIAATPERIGRGKYIFYHVADCVSCHSDRDKRLLTMPVVPGTEGAGGETFDHRLGFPGSFTAKNLTPFHLGDWTDGEIYRAIVSGVNKQGKALFPIMPYENYSQADSEDIYSVIAYLRTLKSVPSEWPASNFDFPVNFIVRTLPKKAVLPAKPETSDTVNYGRYLVNMASCKTCHTQAERGRILETLAFAGGRSMPMPTGGTVHSANITPDMETGIGSWSRDMFIRRFQRYQDSSFTPTPVGKNQFNTIMPWTAYSKMKTSDLASIYAYLQTLKPIRLKVEKFTVH